MKRYCIKCSKEIHIWHEKYHGEADFDPRGWKMWLKIYLLGRQRAWTSSKYWHLDCNQTARVPQITATVKVFAAFIALFLFTAAEFYFTKQSAVVPIPHVGTFVLYWKDGFELYIGSAGASFFFLWKAYEDAN